MRAFSSTLIAELRKEVFSIFWLMELEFSTVQRFIDIDIDVHHNGNRYFSYPFKVGDITYTANMEIDSITLEVANADLSMSAFLLGSDITGSEATISFGCLDSNYQILGVKNIFFGMVSGWKILRDKSVELTVVNEFMLWRKKTLRIAQASCPWPFKGTLSDGLVGYWPFDEGSGTVAHDKTQNANDGTLINMEEADWVDGVSGKCLEFDGGDEQVRLPNVSALKPTAAITLSLWCYAHTINSNDYLFLCGRDNSSGYMIRVTNNNFLFKLWGTGATEVFTGAIANVWTHLVITYQSGIGGIAYKNGVAVGTLANVGDITYSEIYGGYPSIGSHSGLYYFDGLIDGIRIYNRALTQAEITFLYNNPAPDECHYGGAQDWCDQTYERCKMLANKDNFGGFRFLPYIMEKEIWWGGPKPTD